MLPSVGSNHYGILFAIKAPYYNKDPQQTKYNIAKANWDLFNNTLATATLESYLLSNLSAIPAYTKEASNLLLRGEANQLKQQLDKLGKELTKAITKATTIAIPLVYTRPKPKP